MPLCGYKAPGWHAAFDDSHVYLHENGKLHVWNLKTGSEKVVKVGSGTLDIAAAGGFLILYSGAMDCGGGTISQLYAYRNGSVSNLLSALRSSFMEPPEKKVDIIKVLSNGTAALVYLNRPGAEGWEPGHLYLYDGDTPRYIGRYRPESWAGDWILAGEEDRGLYVFNGSCLVPLNADGAEVSGRYVMVDEKGNRTLYTYEDGELKKVGSFGRDAYIHAEIPETGEVLVYRYFTGKNGKHLREVYLVNGTRVWRVPFTLDVDRWISLGYGNGTYLVIHNTETAPGYWKSAVYEWNLTSIKEVLALGSRARVLGYWKGSFLVVTEGNASSMEQTLYSYRGGTLKKLLDVNDVRTKVLFFAGYVVVSNESLQTDPKQVVYRFDGNHLSHVGTFKTSGGAYYSNGSSLLIGGEGVLWDAETGRRFALNGTVKNIEKWRDGVLVQTDGWLYSYSGGRLRPLKLPGKLGGEPLPTCGVEENKLHHETSATAARAEKTGDAGRKLWAAGILALLIGAGLIIAAGAKR